MHYTNKVIKHTRTENCNFYQNSFSFFTSHAQQLTKAKFHLINYFCGVVLIFLTFSASLLCRYFLAPKRTLFPSGKHFTFASRDVNLSVILGWTRLTDQRYLWQEIKFLNIFKTDLQISRNWVESHVSPLHCTHFGSEKCFVWKQIITRRGFNVFESKKKCSAVVMLCQACKIKCY